MRFVARVMAPRAVIPALMACSLIFSAGHAFALTKEAAIERCRMTVGRPIVQACMRSGGGSLEACRGRAKPQVVACVIAALNAANGRDNVAVAVSTETALPAGFVAPPRTISDITAILDGEKPDPKVIEKLKSDADAKPAGTESPRDLSRFYFDRSTARAQLGMVAEAIADASKGVEVGRGAIDANMMGRVKQFLAVQYSNAGDPKKALEIYQQELRETNVPGAKGYQFAANRLVCNILLQMGDLAQAEGYLRRSLALIQEARTS